MAKPVSNRAAAEAVIKRIQLERAKLYKREQRKALKDIGATKKLSRKDREARQVAKEATGTAVEEKGPKQRTALTPKLQKKPVKALAADAKAAATAAELRQSPVVKRQGTPKKGQPKGKKPTNLGDKPNSYTLARKTKPRPNVPGKPASTGKPAARGTTETGVPVRTELKRAAAKAPIPKADEPALSRKIATKRADVEGSQGPKDTTIHNRLVPRQKTIESRVEARSEKAPDKTKTIYDDKTTSIKKPGEKKTIDELTAEALRIQRKGGVGPKKGAKPDLELSPAARKKLAAKKTENVRIKRSGLSGREVGGTGRVGGISGIGLGGGAGHEQMR